MKNKENFMLSKNQFVRFDGNKAMTMAMTEHNTPVLVVYQVDKLGAGAKVAREHIETGEPILVMEFTSIKSIQVLKECFEGLEEFATEKMSEQPSCVCKFKNLNDLIDAYESLQSEVTKMCLKLSKYRRGDK